MNALVIVHLSSLDAYAELYGILPAEALATRMIEVVLEHDGPVYVVDQHWPYVQPYSLPRHGFIVSTELARDIDWRRYDERQDWDAFLRELAHDMKEIGVTKVTLGGVWYDPSKRAGCVTDAYHAFRKNFKTTVDPRIVGCIPTGERSLKGR